MSKVSCLLGHAGQGSQRLVWLVRSLSCIRTGDCGGLGFSLDKLYSCINPPCYKSCLEEVNVHQCLLTCGPEQPRLLYPQDSTMEHLQILKRRTDSILAGLEGNDELTQMQKRYRLGLYDCISSYCGELEGEDRKSCIINYCHRSSTLKV